MENIFDEEIYEKEMCEEINMMLNRHKLRSMTPDEIAAAIIKSSLYHQLTPPLKTFELKDLEPPLKKIAESS